MSYYFSKTINITSDEAVTRVVDPVKEKRFGILTEADLGKTLKNKLGVEFRKCIIPGA